MTQTENDEPAEPGTPAEVFRVFLRLGLTSFGGPVAHLGYFRDEIVVRRRWLGERAYADLVALCQFLPGPASSQVGIGLGLGRAGIPGAFAAWLGFTLPSALAMALFAFGVAAWGDAAGSGWLAGLKAMAVAVVAQAVWGMANALCPDTRTRTIAVAAAIAVIAWPPGWGPVAMAQVGAIGVAAVVGRFVLGTDGTADGEPLAAPVDRRLAVGCLVVFFALLALLPLAAAANGSPALALVDAFYRAGALVFGGGHVVLPLLQASVVEPGWVEPDRFVAGYGAAQAVPGPLFTFAAFLGASVNTGAGGWAGAALAIGAIFLPSFLLVFGVLPFWAQLRSSTGARSALVGVNAAVVGLLAAALYDPVWTGTVHGAGDMVLVLLALLMLVVWRRPPWLVALAMAGIGAGLEAVPGLLAG